MTRLQLTLKSVRARPVVVPLKRPVISKVGWFRAWPMIPIDRYFNARWAPVPIDRRAS